MGYLQPGLATLALIFASALATAASEDPNVPDAELGKRYEQALQVASDRLQLDSAESNQFAMSLLSHLQTPDALARYEWAYSQFNLKTESGPKLALELAEEICQPNFDPKFFANYRAAFTYAFSLEGLAMSFDEAQRFATHAAEMPDPPKYLTAYRKAYDEIIHDGVRDAKGRRRDLLPEFAHIIADQVASSPDPGSALPRYRWVLYDDPIQQTSDILNALDLGRELEGIPERQVLALMKREHIGFAEAARKAIVQANLPRPKAVPIFRDRASDLGASLADTPAFLPPEELSSALPGAGAVDFGGEAICNPELLDIGRSIPGFDEDVRQVEAINEQWEARYTPKVDGKLRQSIRLASEAFDLPEKFLACSYQIESAFNVHAGSRAGAIGIAQIMPAAFLDIRKITLGSDRELASRWGAYGKYEKTQFGYTLPGYDRANNTRDFVAHTNDPIWSIGAGALWCRNYEEKFFGKNADPRRMTIGDLSMLAGAYNMGVGGIERKCRPGKYSACLARLRQSGPLETYNHMLKISACLARK